MKKILTAATFAALLVAGGCQSPDDDPTAPKRRIIIENDETVLSSRFSTDNSGMLDIKTTGIAEGRVHGKPDYDLFLLAEVNPPEYEGQLLRASYVEIAGNKAFVAYNTEGDQYLGGVDVYDISDEESPRLISQAIFPYTDVSAIAFDDEAIYLAEATDVDLDPAFDSPAVVERIMLNGGLLTEESKRLGVEGFVATGIGVGEHNLFATSATAGGLTVFNKYSFEPTFYVEIDQARDLIVKGNTVAIASGVPGRVTFFDNGSRSTVGEYEIGGAEAEEARTGLDYMGNDIVFAAGAAGVLLLDGKSGEVSSAVELSEVEGVDPADVVSNSVSVNGGMVLMANGAAGLYVGKPKGKSIELEGSIDLGASANVVKSRGNIIFVATGTGGLKIVGIKR